MAHRIFSPLLIAALGLGNVVRAAVGAPQHIPGRYMVEFDKDEDQFTFSSHLQFDKRSAELVVSTESDIFRGASYQFDSGKAEDPVALLKALPSVKNVWPVMLFQRPNVTSSWAGSSLNSIPEDIKKYVTANNGSYAPHLSTQVDRLHAEGFSGKGIKIGIVDDGIDYKHPALGGGFGPGFVVTHGYDHVGDEWWGGEGQVPETGPDPYAQCGGHGSHVAGIVGAQKNPLGFVGAAPGAAIGMYRVFGCGGSTSSDILLAGFNKAYADGNHIITASLGGYSGWSEDPLSVMGERLVEKGVILTAAQGNTGGLGPFFTEAPGNGKGVIAVGSVANTEIPRVFYNASYTVGNTTTNSTVEPFGWTYGVPAEWGNVSLPLLVGEPNEFPCDMFPNHKNLSGYILLIKDDSICSQLFIAESALRKGGKYMLWWRDDNDDEGVSNIFIDPGSGFLPGTPYPNAVGSVPRATAKNWIALAASGKRIVVNITDPKYLKPFVDNAVSPGASSMNEWSTWGPTFELDLKPDISAPGGYILSTWPTNAGSYAVISGTSMATPLVAGIAALILEARGKLTPSEFLNIISSTAKPLITLNSTGPAPDLEPVAHQGAGIIQAWDAVHSKGIISTSKILLNDTDNFVGTHEFTIKNEGKAEVTYVLSNQAAPSFNTLNDRFGPPQPPPVPVIRQYANISFSQSRITVAPGQEVSVSLTVIPPKLDTVYLPIYSGFVRLDGSDGAKLTIPYLGAATSMRTMNNIGDANVIRTDNWQNPIAPQGQAYVLPLPGSNSTRNIMYPNLDIQVLLGLPKLDVAVYTVKTLGSAEHGSAPLDQHLGSLPGAPMYYKSRFPLVHFLWNGTLSDGKQVPSGNYTLVVNSLRILGNPDKKEDYLSKRMIDFSIEYV